MWPSVLAELEAFKAQLPLLEADWRRPWSPHVTCTDASLAGWGVCTSFGNKTKINLSIYLVLILLELHQHVL